MSMSLCPNHGHVSQVLHGTYISALALFPNAPDGGYGANDAPTGALVRRDPRRMKFLITSNVGLGGILNGNLVDKPLFERYKMV